MHKVRIIPTLLYKDNLVKGKMFKSWRVVGNLYQMIKLYNLREVDELIFFDIDANQKNKIQFDLIDEFADDCFVPLTIGGGVKSLQDIEQLLKVGADKVCINSTAVNDLDFVKKAVDKYGSQCIVISIDYKINKDKMTEVFTSSGNKATNLSLEEHIKNLDEVSPGEIILTSIDHDGMMNGYDIEKIKKISNSSSIPVIASGGAGCVNDFYQVIKDADIKALSAASIFHFTEITPLDVKKFLKTKNINVRL
jgi:imidazole glycerol-phosphate synthase subunit HisF